MPPSSTNASTVSRPHLRSRRPMLLRGFPLAVFEPGLTALRLVGAFLGAPLGPVFGAVFRGPFPPLDGVAFRSGLKGTPGQATGWAERTIRTGDLDQEVPTR